MSNIHTFKQILREYDCIVIPKIQRDYAQGRNTEKAKDVRTNILNDIFSGRTKSLDFIFGTAQGIKEKERKIFLPLDGQQRLTTLFLLYLYGNKMKELVIENLNKFSYETRKAACDFCKKIVEVDWPEDIGPTLSKSIINQNWFMHYWINDPTVEGMLTMLDDIHKRAKDLNADKYPNLDEITFHFFDMNEHNLSDDLYIKMNSRGKPLTAFENIKAKIDKMLPKEISTNITRKSFNWLKDPNLTNKSFSKKWKHCIDGKWSDMFWNYKENYLTDASFLRFFANMLSCYWIIKNEITSDEDGENNPFLLFLLGITGSEDYISFEKFKEVLPLKQETENETEDELSKRRYDTLLYLADCLNSFYLVQKIDELPDITRPSWEDNNYNLIKKILQLNDNNQYNPSNKERAMFYALIKCPYIPNLIDSVESEKTIIKKIKQWMRVTWNIVEQAEARTRNLIASVKLIDELSSKIKDNRGIYLWLSDDKTTIKSGFMENQVNEERIKAKHILDNDFLEEDIIYAESHPLLKGCISAIFKNDKCDEVSFGQTIRYRRDLLDELYKADDDYKLVKVLVSQYDNHQQFEKLKLKKDLDNLKSLVTDKLKECYRKNENNVINCNCSGWQRMISNTYLINNSRESGKILSCYGENVVLWGTSGCNWNAYENVILDNTHYNPMLSKLVNEKRIECNQKINDCDFFWGRDINFKYEAHFFRWLSNPNNIEMDVYLMKDNWSDYENTNFTLDKGTDKDTYYCFRVTDNMTSEDFLNELDKLIEEQKNS